MKHIYSGVTLRIVASLIWSFVLTGGSAQTPVRLTAGGASGSEPKEFATYNGRLYFSATTNDDVPGSPPIIDGQEVYSTNGTLAGTSLLKNINTGAGLGSDPKEFTEYNGKLYFSATTGANGRELWVTDGTAGGTVLFKDIHPGSSAGDPTELTTCNGRLYFVAQNGPQRELWVSDGTSGGTQRLSDALGVSTGGANPSALTCSGDKLFYRFTPRNDLWFTNGTALNTRFVKGGPLIPLNPDGPRLFISLNQLTALDGKLIFRGNSPGTEDEPWVSDGTPEGTFTLDVQPGALGSFPTDFYAFNGRVYFNSATLNSFWSTNGTIAGTQRIKSSFMAKEPTGFNGKLYFFFGSQFWVTDGTEAGTLLVKNLAGGPGTNTPRELTVVGGKLYFIVKSTTSLTAGGQLWTSDGTETGTNPVTTISHPVSFVPQSFIELVPFNDQLLFTAVTTFSGPELWRLMPPVSIILQLLAPVYNCSTGALTLITSGGNGSPIVFNAPGVQRSSLDAVNGTVESELRNDPKPILLQATQSGTTVSFTFDLPGACGGSLFRLVAPAYNCATGAITFNTSGGDGLPIEYAAAGITGWTSDPNQFVDLESRTVNDVQPFTLMARQNGVMVTYVWNLKAACGRARRGVGEPTTELVVTVLANPTASGAAEIEISGADGESLHWTVSDARGRSISDGHIERAVLLEKRTVRLNQEPGLYFLRVSTPTQVKTIKIIRQ